MIWRAARAVRRAMGSRQSSKDQGKRRCCEVKAASYYAWGSRGSAPSVGPGGNATATSSSRLLRVSLSNVPAGRCSRRAACMAGGIALGKGSASQRKRVYNDTPSEQGPPAVVSYTDEMEERRAEFPATSESRTTASMPSRSASRTSATRRRRKFGSCISRKAKRTTGAILAPGDMGGSGGHDGCPEEMMSPEGVGGAFSPERDGRGGLAGAQGGRSSVAGGGGDDDGCGGERGSGGCCGESGGDGE